MSYLCEPGHSLAAVSPGVWAEVWVARGSSRLMFPENSARFYYNHIGTQNQARQLPERKQAAGNEPVLGIRLPFRWTVTCQANVFLLLLEPTKVIALRSQGQGAGSLHSLAGCVL